MALCPTLVLLLLASSSFIVVLVCGGVVSPYGGQDFATSMVQYNSTSSTCGGSLLSLSFGRDYCSTAFGFASRFRCGSGNVWEAALWFGSPTCQGNADFVIPANPSCDVRHDSDRDDICSVDVPPELNALSLGRNRFKFEIVGSDPSAAGVACPTGPDPAAATSFVQFRTTACKGSTKAHRPFRCPPAAPCEGNKDYIEDCVDDPNGGCCVPSSAGGCVPESSEGFPNCSAYSLPCPEPCHDFGSGVCTPNIGSPSEPTPCPALTSQGDCCFFGMVNDQCEDQRKSERWVDNGGAVFQAFSGVTDCSGTPVFTHGPHGVGDCFVHTTGGTQKILSISQCTESTNPGKTIVCHKAGHRFRKIEVANAALHAHANHGDVAPGTNGLDCNCAPAGSAVVAPPTNSASTSSASSAMLAGLIIAGVAVVAVAALVVRRRRRRQRTAAHLEELDQIESAQLRTSSKTSLTTVASTYNQEESIQ